MDNASTSYQPKSHPASAHGAKNTADAVTLGLGWAALSDASSIVAQLAGQPNEENPLLAPQFAARLWGAEPWRAELVEKGIADLHAVMEPGIATLLGVCEIGGNCRPAAQSLWREFASARCALLALLPVEDDHPAGPNFN